MSALIIGLMRCRAMSVHPSAITVESSWALASAALRVAEAVEHRGELLLPEPCARHQFTVADGMQLLLVDLLGPVWGPCDAAEC
jgi:hypothetical protein